MARLSSELVLTLRDNVSGPARRVGQSIEEIERRTRAAEQRIMRRRRVQTEMIAGVGRAANAVVAAAGSVLAPAAIALAGQQAYTRFAEVERALNRIGVTAGASAAEVKAAMGTVRQAAYDTAQGQDQVTAGLEALVAAGRSLPEAMAFLPSVARTAQAAGADIVDIATTADAVGRNFGIAGDRMQGAFDILVRGGQLGKFELKDMASYLPSLAPAFEVLGYRGEAGLKKLVSALQVVRDGTGSAGEAATSFQNVIQKMESEETTKRFEDFGINLRGAMATARKEGRDLLDVFVELSNKAVGGDLSKLPQLFADSEMQRGMRALMTGMPQLTSMVQELGSAAGSTQKALDTLLSDNQAKIDRMTSSWDGFVTSLGSTAAPVVAPVLEAISGKLDRDAAIERGWAAETDSGLSGRDVRTEFERRYAEVNPDYNSRNPLAWPAVTNALNDALARVGRGEAKTVYDSLDQQRVAQASAARAKANGGVDPLQFGPYRPGSIDGAPVTRNGAPVPRVPGPSGAPPMSEADQRRTYGEGRRAGEQYLATQAPRDATAAASVQRIEATQARIEAAVVRAERIALGQAAPDLPSAAPGSGPRRPDRVRQAIGVAEGIGRAEAKSRESGGLLSRDYQSDAAEGRAKLAELTAGMPEAARQGMEAYAAAVSAAGGQVTEQARVIGENIRTMLSITATPNVDTSPIDAAQAKVDRLSSSLQALSGNMQAARNAAASASADYDSLHANIEE